MYGPVCYPEWTLMAQRYADEILITHVVAYAAAIIDSFLLLYDNARPHTARFVGNILETEAI